MTTMFLFIFLILDLSAPAGPEPSITPGRLHSLIPKRHVKKWTRGSISRTANELDAVSRRTGEDVDKILALIKIESDFNPRDVSGPNRDGTYDIGLTQQNSRWVQARCRKLLGRRCSWRELKKPRLSVRLMERTFKECRARGVRGDWLYDCYNNPARAERKTGSRHFTRWRKAYGRIRSGR